MTTLSKRFIEYETKKEKDKMMMIITIVTLGLLCLETGINVGSRVQDAHLKFFWRGSICL